MEIGRVPDVRYDAERDRYSCKSAEGVEDRDIQE